MAPKTAPAKSEAKMAGKLTEARRAWEAACRAWSQDTLGQSISRARPVMAGEKTYQARVHEWVVSCFGEAAAADGVERNHRFLEEALELVQAAGCTAGEAHQLVDYVFGRPIGEPGQEVGGVMNTLAALCNAHGLNLDGEAERELARVWTISDKIRAKHAAKPKHSPLPGSLSQGGRGDG